MSAFVPSGDTHILTSRLTALKGSIKVGSEPIVHEQFYTLVLSGDETETGVQITAVDEDSEALIVCVFTIECLPSC